MNTTLWPRRRAVGPSPFRLAGWLTAAALVGAAIVGPAAPLTLAVSDHANDNAQQQAGGNGNAGGNQGGGNGQGNGDAGAIWTTSAPCQSPAPQDQNLYKTGDTVSIRGANFQPNTASSWSITGNPGGSSGDPGAVVASGTVTADGTGWFCVAAYTIPADDWGEYTVDVGTKNDNYRVNASTPIDSGGTGGAGGGQTGSGQTGGGTGGTGDTGGGQTGGSQTGGSTPGGQTGDTSSGGTTAGDNGGGQTGGGTSDGTTTGDNTGGQTGGSSGGTTAGDNGGGQTGGGQTGGSTSGGQTGDTSSGGATGGEAVQPVVVPQQPAPPAGAVLGATGRPHLTLPPTDTLSPAAALAPDATAWQLVLVGLAAFLASLLLLTPGRAASRRSRR